MYCFLVELCIYLQNYRVERLAVRVAFECLFLTPARTHTHNTNTQHKHTNFAPNVFLELSNANLLRFGQHLRLPPPLPVALRRTHTHTLSIAHVHTPGNTPPSRDGMNIPPCTVMEPPGGLQLARNIPRRRLQAPGRLSGWRSHYQDSFWASM